MSFLQKFLISILPKTWVNEMRAESLDWMLRCSCGHETSIWESGGVRWKARGNPRRYRTCPECGEANWQRAFRKMQ